MGGGSSPAAALLGSDPGSFAALCGEELGGSGVGVAPAEVGLQPAGEHDVVGIVGVVQHELAQGTEVTLVVRLGWVQKSLELPAKVLQVMSGAQAGVALTFENKAEALQLLTPFLS